MPYKIIETIERGRRYVTTIPSLWESDGNLYWPRKNVTLLKKNEKSTPQLDWKCLPCILKRDNIPDYKTAEQEVVLMSDATDTDDKENEYPQNKTSVQLNLNQECIQLIQLAEDASPVVTTAVDTSSVPTREFKLSSMMAAEDASSTLMAEDSSSITVVESNARVSTDVDNIIIQDILQENTSGQPLLLESGEANITQVSQQMGFFIEIVSAVQENQKILFENQQNILKGIALLNTKLDEFITRSQGSFQHVRYEESSRFKTITNIEELKVFEEQLKDPSMDRKYYEELSIICSEKKTGLNNAYALVDAMFDRNLMTCCSWGGGTKGEPKHCFKAYTKTIDLFLKVVHQYDKTFSKPICEDFFQNVMRHATKRNAAKRVRKSATKSKIKKREPVNNQEENRPGPSNDN